MKIRAGRTGRTGPTLDPRGGDRAVGRFCCWGPDGDPVQVLDSRDLLAPAALELAQMLDERGVVEAKPIRRLVRAVLSRRRLRDVLHDQLRTVQEELIGDGKINGRVLPGALRADLGGIAASQACGTPAWAMVAAPVDWPALLRAHPDLLGIEPAAVEQNGGASWPQVAAAYQLLARAGLTPVIETYLEVDDRARITLFPMWLRVETGTVLPEVHAAVSAALVAGGRDRQAQCATATEWQLTC